MSSKFLDKTGLDTLWAKIKSTFQTLGNLVTAWGSTPSDTKYPSEKLVKTSLDAKAPNAVTTEAAIATGDKLLFSDASDSSKTKRMGTGFDTGVSTTVLKRSGVFDYVKEADVTWGGSFRSELSPAEFGNMARNLIHNPITTAITFDKSTDGGATWVSQTISDALKRALCNLAGGGAGGNFGIPNSAYSGISDPSLLQGRITVYAISGPNVTTAEDTWFYGIAKRILMKVSRNGSAKMKVDYQTWPHFIADDGVWGDAGTFDVQGDSGWNSIPFDNTIGGYSGQLTSGRITAIRFTFWIASGSAPRIAIINLGFLPQIHWRSNAGNIPLLGVPVYVNDDGTGTINAAAKLQTSRKLAVSLSNTSTDTSFNGSADVTNIKTTGTLGIENGGTGATTAIGAEYNILNQVADIDTTINGDRKIALCNQTKSASNGVFRWLKLSNVWTWIKGLLSSESGVNISGNAATATTAAGYTSGGAIDTALQGKATPADITSAIQALDVDSQGGDGKYIKAISEADGKIIATAETMDTAPTANSTKAVTSGGVKTALDDKQDNLGISSSGDAGKFLNEKGEWATPTGTEQVNADWDATSGKAEILHKPTVSRYFNKYSGGTSVYGWKIGSTVTRNAEGVSSIITGVFTLALGIRVENAPQESTAVKTMATMVGFFSCYARYESGANVVKARIYTPVSSIFNATFNLKYIDEGNGKFTWVFGFGTGTTPESKDFVYCSVNVMSSINADFENFGDAITSSPTYADFFSVFKSPVIGQDTSGVGNATKPVYVDTNGFIKECTSVNADTVDGFHFSTSTSGSATNTVYLV